MIGSNNFWANFGRPDGNLDSPYEWFYNAWNACFFWSQPYNGVNDSEGHCKYKATIGRSSYNIEQFPTENGNNYIGEEWPSDNFGYENCPEYVACLPLIKI